MKTIYQQHDAAFKNVSAYLIIHAGKPVAKVAFKFPKDGALHGAGFTVMQAV